MKTIKLILLVSIIAGTAISCSFEKKVSSEEISIQQSIASPDGEYTARYYTVSGGGGGGYVLHFVNIQQSQSKFDNTKGNVFHAAHSDRISIHWKGNQKLVIMYSKHTDISFNKDLYSDNRSIKVKYISEND